MQTYLRGALAAAATLFFTLPAAAERVQLPAPSPGALVTQTVGITEVTVQYSSPGVKGRKIFGELVPHDKVWRTGANAATTLTFSHDVKVAGSAVPAGTYSVLTIPKKGTWTVILNKDVKASTQTYKQDKDQLRFEAKTTKIPARERMAFIFSNTKPGSTELDLEWDTTRLRFDIAVDTAATAKAGIEAYLKDAQASLARAARYLSEDLGEHDKALHYANAALAVEKTWFAEWITASIHKKKGNNAEALAHAKAAWELGNKAEYFFWKDQVAKALKEWK